jgi:4'-phosphopantetheinyl transferase
LNRYLQTFILPPIDLELGANEIHIWLAVMSQPVFRFNEYIQTLSDEERLRAEKYYSERDRNSFIFRRGILRTILGRYLDVEPCRLQFCYGKYGKPKLDVRFGNGTVHFNLSHSHGVALYAFARDSEIGVDIECMSDISEMEHVVETTYSIKEKEVFRSLPENQKREAFFHYWTCKEAIIKALGYGLSRPVDKYEVPLLPGEPVKMLKIEGDSREASRWSIQAMKLAPNYTGAFAVKSEVYETKHWRWDLALTGMILREY